MKQTLCWMMAALVLSLVSTGCGDSKPASLQSPAAVAPADAIASPASFPAPDAEPFALPEVDPTALVANVNGKEIAEADVQKVLKMFMKQMGGRIPADQVATAIPRIRERIVEELIMRSVMLDAVAKEGVSLSDSEFAEVKAELAEELPPGTSLEAYMAETGTTEAEMREQMAVRKMIMAKAESLSKPSDEEIKAFFEENKEGFSQGETVRASHILLKLDPSDDEAAKTAKRERIEGLRKQLIDGADFAEVAKENSDCPSSSAGGDLGNFGRGQMVPAFEDAAYAQPVGTVGEVVETQFGFHLIKVSEHTQAKTSDFDEVKSRISDILFSQKQQDAVRDYVDGLRSQAKIQRFDEAPASETLLQLDVEEADVEDAPPVAVASEAAVVAEPEIAEEVAAETTPVAEAAPEGADVIPASEDALPLVGDDVSAPEEVPVDEAPAAIEPAPAAEEIPAVVEPEEAAPAAAE